MSDDRIRFGSATVASAIARSVPGGTFWTVWAYRTHMGFSGWVQPQPTGWTEREGAEKFAATLPRHYLAIAIIEIGIPTPTAAERAKGEATR